MIDNAARAEEEGHFSDAVIFYNRVLELSPRDTTTEKLKDRVVHAIDVARLINQGVKAYYAADLDSAEYYFGRVLRIEPGNNVAQEYLGIIASLRQQPPGQDQLQADEETWKTYLKALEYYQNEDFENAIRLWEEVLQKYPNNEQTLNNIKQARLRLESQNNPNAD